VETTNTFLRLSFFFKNSDARRAARRDGKMPKTADPLPDKRLAEAPWRRSSFLISRIALNLLFRELSRLLVKSFASVDEGPF
jgi:hypothetical protein